MSTPTPAKYKIKEPLEIPINEEISIVLIKNEILQGADMEDNKVCLCIDLNKSDFAGMIIPGKSIMTIKVPADRVEKISEVSTGGFFDSLKP